MKFYLALTTLAAVWGASFVFLRIGSPEFGPVPLIFVRTLVAAAVLWPFVIYAKNSQQIFRHWKVFLLVGAMSTAVPFTLFAYTSLYLPASHTSILNATTPFFSAIVAYFWLHERVSKVGALGLAIGFSGVYFLSSSDSAMSGSLVDVALPVIAVLFATFLYAVSSVYAKLKMSHFSAVTVATGSQMYSALLLAPLAIYLWPEASPSKVAWGSVVAMGIFSTALALIVFFTMLQRVGVTKTVAVTYLIPLFGILWGNLFLDETISISMAFGGLLILLGVGLTTGTSRGQKQ